MNREMTEELPTQRTKLSVYLTIQLSKQINSQAANETGKQFGEQVRNRYINKKLRSYTAGQLSISVTKELNLTKRMYVM